MQPRLTTSGLGHQAEEGEKRCLNSELWHACAGPLVSLPSIGSRVVYFPQGHSEQVAASTNKEVDTHIPNYPSLPPQLICQLHDVIMHADAETDEVYAQMTLQPLTLQEQKDAYLPAELGTPSRQPTNYFCKRLTASDTSTHGGFSVPRRAAEKVFPPLDFTQQPPSQELIARDLHGNEWKFRHIFRGAFTKYNSSSFTVTKTSNTGQPKRHLLTTGWSVFVSSKRLVAGDAVIFIWNEKNQLLLGIRHGNRPQSVMPSLVLSSDSMHIGLLAAAAHAAATNSRFTVFYNPRASPSEFVIPLTRYAKAVFHTRISVGMRFRMLFETEESSVRRYMGTITGICDLDPARWPNSHWRSIKVGWDESTAGERQPRVSLWEIEPLTTFPMYPSPFPLRLKRPWPSGLPSLHGIKDDNLGLNSSLMWLRGNGIDHGFQSLNFQGIGVNPWMQPRFDSSLLGVHPEMAPAAFQEMRTVDRTKLASTVMQFQQQPHNMSPRSVPFLQSQIMQQTQPQSQQILRSAPQESQPQSHMLTHQFQQQRPLIHEHIHHQQTQKSHQCQEPQQHHQQLPNQNVPQQQSFQIPNIVSELSQLSQLSSSHSPSLQNVPSLCQTQNFMDSVLHDNAISATNMSALQKIMGSISPDDQSHLFNLPPTVPPVSSSSWPSKEIAVGSVLPSGGRSGQHTLQQSVSQTQSASHHSISLPPFPGRDSAIDHGVGDPQSNSILFGVNIDSSQLMQNGPTPIGASSNDNTQTAFSCGGSNHLTAPRAYLPLNSSMGSSSGCFMDENGFLTSPDDVGLVDPPDRTFVKVHKLGSYGRSLDITNFSSYHELRSELASMFGLEGQLEDPLRSGWQLVFVDRENDVLLLGDDPWQEFVNNVWCIKILSPQEVQQMGRQDLALLHSISLQRQDSSTCDDFANQQNSRNPSSGITSVESLDY